MLLYGVRIDTRGDLFTAYMVFSGQAVSALFIFAEGQ